MSESVWFEQVDNALIKLIKSNITVSGKAVDCRVRKPDEDFKKEEYPLVSLYNVYSRRDDFRRFNGVVPIERDMVNYKLIVEQASLPYNLFYQIDFWAMQQAHMNSMLYQWIALTSGGKDFNLHVVDTGGNERSCYCLCTDDLKKADLVEDNRRLFHSFITYRIYVEIDENVRSEEALIVELGVTTEQEV